MNKFKTKDSGIEMTIYGGGFISLQPSGHSCYDNNDYSIVMSDEQFEELIKFYKTYKSSSVGGLSRPKGANSDVDK